MIDLEPSKRFKRSKKKKRSNNCSNNKIRMFKIINPILISSSITKLFLV